MPNTDAPCAGQPDSFCTGYVNAAGESDGKCTAVSRLAEELQAAGYSAEHLRHVPRPDGTTELRTKEKGWFGDEQLGVQPPAAPTWARQTRAGAGAGAGAGEGEEWAAFDEFNTLVLEEAWTEGRPSAVVDLGDYSRGSLFVNFADMVLYFSTGETQKVRRSAPVGSVAERKFSVEDAARVKDLNEAQRAAIN